VDGSLGDTGTSGATGPEGTVGSQGPPGRPGVEGWTGASGDTGSSGNVGAPGATGYTGAIGTTGRTGARGNNCLKIVQAVAEIADRTAYDGLITHYLDYNTPQYCELASNVNKMVTWSRKRHITSQRNFSILVWGV